MKWIGKRFVHGLMAILPIALTLYLIYWLATSAESVLGAVIRYVIGDAYVPGLGVLFGFLITLGIGVLLQLWLFRKVFSLGEALLQKIPGIKSLYGSIRDLVGFFDSSKEKDFDKIVMVAVGKNRLMAQDKGVSTTEGGRGHQTVAVYLLMSYQLGGFTIMVPKDKIHPVDMTVDRAISFVLTAGSQPKARPTRRRLNNTGWRSVDPERVCKPSSVPPDDGGDVYLTGRRPALRRSGSDLPTGRPPRRTRTRATCGRSRPAAWSCRRWGLPADDVVAVAGALTAPFSPLPPPQADRPCFLWHFPCRPGGR